MGEKKILFMFLRPPFGNIYYTEGLRAAVGMMSGLDEHKVTCVYLGDGAFYSLKDRYKEDTRGYLNTLEKFGELNLNVEKESLDELDISEDEVDTMFKVVSRDEVADMIKECDFAYDF